MYRIIKKGFERGLQQWRIAAIVYCIQLFLVLTFGMQVYDVLKASIGRSLEINKLVEGYDHTVIMDFIKVHGASITPLLGQLRWMLLVWLLFSVFSNGGLLYCAVQTKLVTSRVFWQGGAAIFFPFLTISLFFLFLLLVWSGIVWMPVVVLIEPMLAFFPSEKYIVWLILVLLFIWLLGLGMLFIWSVVSRVGYLRKGESVKISMVEGWHVLGRQKKDFWGLLVFFEGLKALLLVGYFLLDAMVDVRSSGIVFWLFMLQQAVVFGKVLVRQMVYASIGLKVGV
jgi:hypothetical protein